MSAVDINSLSYEELAALAAAANARLASTRSARCIDVAKRVYQLVKAAGFTLDDVLPHLQEPDFVTNLELEIAEALKRANSAKKPRKSLPMKYQNPADSKQQWSGKGRLPGWAATHVAAGGKLEELLIQK